MRRGRREKEPPRLHGDRRHRNPRARGWLPHDASLLEPAPELLQIYAGSRVNRHPCLQRIFRTPATDESAAWSETSGPPWSWHSDSGIGISPKTCPASSTLSIRARARTRIFGTGTRSRHQRRSSIARRFITPERREDKAQVTIRRQPCGEFSLRETRSSHRRSPAPSAGPFAAVARRGPVDTARQLTLLLRTAGTKSSGRHIREAGLSPPMSNKIRAQF